MSSLDSLLVGLLVRFGIFGVANELFRHDTYLLSKKETVQIEMLLDLHRQFPAILIEDYTEIRVRQRKPGEICANSTRC